MFGSKISCVHVADSSPAAPTSHLFLMCWFLHACQSPTASAQRPARRGGSLEAATAIQRLNIKKKATNGGLHRRRHIVEGDALYITIITSRCPRCYFSSIILVMARWRGVSKYLWRFLRFTLQADTDGWPNISPTFHPLDPRFHNLFQFCFGLFPSFPRAGVCGGAA